MRQERVPVSQVLRAEPLVDLPEDTENKYCTVPDKKPKMWQDDCSTRAAILTNNKQE